jgi:hypothetical protein
MGLDATASAVGEDDDRKARVDYLGEDIVGMDHGRHQRR